MIVTYLPWLLSALTIWMMWAAGNKNPNAWLVGALSQVLWAVWIFETEAWGLVPMNVALAFVYTRNLVKWEFGEGKCAKQR